MARKSDIKICRFKGCTHPEREIDISIDDYELVGKAAYYHRECLAEQNRQKAFKKCAAADKCKCGNKPIDTTGTGFIQKGNKYYHKECWEEGQGLSKDDATKADIQLIKNLWLERINRTVVVSYLYKELNALIRDQGIDSKYVVFVVEYCIEKKLNLRFPGGLKYFVDKQEIKDAYARKRAREVVGKATFEADESETDDSPKFTFTQKPRGFNTILRRK